VKGLFGSVAKAAQGWQGTAANFDFEVFALPGGSVIAPVLWACSTVVRLFRKAACI
jgi:hypothetical protein